MLRRRGGNDRRPRSGSWSGGPVEAEEDGRSGFGRSAGDNLILWFLWFLWSAAVSGQVRHKTEPLGRLSRRTPTVTVRQAVKQESFSSGDSSSSGSTCSQQHLRGTRSPSGLARRLLPGTWHLAPGSTRTLL